MRDRVDVLVITALPVERKALLQYLRNPTQVEDFSVECYEARVGSTNGRAGTVVVACLHKVGNVFAAAATRILLDRWQPELVVSFGIAGGLVDGDPLKLDRIKYGDVIFARSVFYYEFATETGRQTSNNWFPSIPAEGRLVSIVDRVYDGAAELAGRNWQQRILIEAPVASDQPRVFVDQIASGEKVIRSIESPSRLKATEHYSKVRAFDMEAFGVAASIDECSDPRPAFVAIKGIADYAEEGKGDIWQSYASHAASAFLVDFLELIVEGRRSAIFPREDTFEGDERPRLLTQKAKDFRDTIPASYQKKCDLFELRRLMADGPCEVFYHWRLLHVNVHWVDFCFWLVLRKLRSPDFRINLLISDRVIIDSKIGDVRTEDSRLRARERTKSLVYSVFGPSVDIWWLSDIESDRARFEGYGSARGLDPDLERLFDNSSHIFGRDGGNDIIKTWMRFIAWKFNSRRLIILSWKRHAEMWRHILAYTTLRAAIVETEDFMLGRRLGKVDLPGSDLVISPPSFSSIMSWTMTEKSVARLRCFWQYVSLEQRDADTVIQRSRGFLRAERIGPLEKGESLSYLAEKRKLSELEKYRLCIGLNLLEWNRDFGLSYE